VWTRTVQLLANAGMPLFAVASETFPVNTAGHFKQGNVVDAQI
jgi:hypothetical protein